MKRAVLFGVVGVIFLIAAQSAWAVYVLILRNGGRVVARDKYQVKGPNALFVSKIGTYTSIPLSQIDVEATDKVNSQGLGDAQLLAWVDAKKVVPTPTPTPLITALGHLQEGLAAKIGDAALPTPTPGITFRDTHYRDPQVEEAFQQGLESYHLYLYRTSQGTQPAYLFIEISVNGQPETLKALMAVAETYELLAKKAPGRLPERVEVQMLNESGKEAGVFRLSAADAAELATGKVTPENFYVQHVIF